MFIIYRKTFEEERQFGHIFWRKSTSGRKLKFKNPTNHSTHSTTMAFESQNTPDTRTWLKTSPTIRRAGRKAFHIPNHLRSKILPDPNLSINAMLDFRIPNSINVLTVSAPLKPAQFFAKADPDPITAQTFTLLGRLEMPSKAMIQMLRENVGQAWLDGFKTTKYTHLHDSVTTNFPLWVISFWMAVMDLRETVKSPWMESKAWLAKQIRQHTNPGLRSLAEEASVLLARLPWGGKKLGLSDSDKVHTFSAFLGTEWMSGTLIDNMLDLIFLEVLSNPALVKTVRIQGVYLSERLIGAYATRDSDKYQTEKEFAWLRDLGNDIVTNNALLVTIAHLASHNRGPHWTPLAIDLRNEVSKALCYGDSFGEPIPEHLQAVYTWWIEQHTISDTFIPLPLANIPITKQSDSFSCGMLAENAVGNLVSPNTHPLMKPSELVEGRIKMFIKLAEHVLERVCDLISSCN